MANDPDSIERQISNVRETLGRQLSAAEEKAREVIDWRTHYTRNPWPLLAAAAAVGFVASAAIGGNGHGHHNGHDARGYEGGGPTGRGALGALGAPLKSASVNNALEHLLDAFVAAATVKVADYVEQWMPGFHDEFDRRHR